MFVSSFGFSQTQSNPAHVHLNHCTFKNNDPDGGLSTEGGAMTVLVGERTLGCSKGEACGNMEYWTDRRALEAFKRKPQGMKREAST
jgi:hypothetical protein